MAPGSRTTIIAAFVLASAFPAAAQMPLGSEFRVDTRGAGISYFQWTRRSAAMSPDGDFVVTWVANNAGDLRDIVARRFDASARPQGPEFLVNTYTTGRQFNDSVGMDDAGNFVIVWAGGPTGTDYRVFAQRFAASGARIGTEFRVSEATTFVEMQPMVAVAPDGAFVVVWMSNRDGDSWGIFGRRFDASGTPAGIEFQVNTYTPGQQYTPSVDTDGAGNFVVAWTSVPPFPQGGPSTARAQRYAADGVRQGTEVQVSSGSNHQSRTRLARSRDGSFVVTWTSPAGVFARKFDATGTPVGGDFMVNVFTTGGTDHPEIDADADGDFVIVWESPTQDGSANGVLARRFDFAGGAGPEFRVNTYTTGWQNYPVVGVNPSGNFVVAWQSADSTPIKIVAQRYAGGLSPAALVVDVSAGPTSDGNRVFEAGETVAIAPAWLNANFGAETFTGTASSFTGPGTPGDPTYTIADAAASYGTVASGATASCSASSDCYALGVTVPSARPAQHWDATFRETISPANLGATKTWTLHIGESFTDVPRASGFYRSIETLLHHGITAGCSFVPRNTYIYCPSARVTREQMAPFLLLAKEGAGYSPPPCAGGRRFDDVPASNPFCSWIEELARRGIVNGCTRAKYCPNLAVSRQEMAIFVLLTLDPTMNPPDCSPPNIYPDVPESSPFCRWIEELANRGVFADCGGGNYCPTLPVTREQIAFFLSATFGLTLYGP